MAILFASDFPSESTRLRRVADGSVQTVARGVWTDEVHIETVHAVEQHWREIVAHFLPGAVITGRTAFTHEPEAGHLFVSHARWRPLELPGLTVYPDGRGEQRDDDVAIIDGLYGASLIRAIIDNAETRGRPSDPPRRFRTDELQARIRELLQPMSAGERALLLRALERGTDSLSGDAVRQLIAGAEDAPLFELP